MLKFNKCNLSPSKVDSWINLGVNVLLIGEKGVGKTQRVIEAFKRNNLKYAYFSGSTLDPWIHLIGVPKVNDRDGKQVLDFILPQNLDENVEAIFIDEYNRSPKIVRNAILELQQFKSINGRQFPKLKMVWAAINPPKDEADEDSQDYDVDEIDPAQMDRFQVIVELSSSPDKSYFKKRFGDYHGNCLVNWWVDQSKLAKQILSPRRLEYIGDFYNQGGDISDLLPTCANPNELIKVLSISKEDVLLDKIFNNPDEATFKTFMSDNKNYLKYRNRLNSPKFYPFFKHLKPEYICENIKTNQGFQNYAIYCYLKGESEYISAIEEVSKSTKSDLLLKTCKMLAIQKTDISNVFTQNVKVNRADAFGNQSDVFSPDTRIVNISQLLSNRFDPDIVHEHMLTPDYRTVFAKLATCYNRVPPEKYKVVASFVFAMLQSCQATTLKGDPYFFKTFHNLLPLIKSVLSANEWKSCESMIQAQYKKYPTDGYYQNVLTIARSSATGNSCGELSKEFVNKIEQTFALVELSQNL